MNPDRHHRVKDLFLDACGRPEGERAGFLDEACGGDAELQAEVEELLGYHERARAETAAVPDGGLDDLESVGDYRIIYEFDLNRNEIHLITLGHRREIYRRQD